MSVAPPWTKHAQIVWENRGADTRLPLWMRVACLAYGNHEANLHACYKRGDLQMILGTPATDTSPSRKALRQHVHSAIQTAVEYGWLASGSCARCLVVPAHAVEGPRPGNPLKRCPIHQPQQSRAA